jgi:hypothetical protein
MASPEEVLASAVVIPDRALQELLLAERRHLALVVRACVEGGEDLKRVAQELQKVDQLVRDRLAQLEEAS